jgi:hypothetical protein
MFLVAATAVGSLAFAAPAHANGPCIVPQNGQPVCLVSQAIGGTCDFPTVYVPLLDVCILG